jgi:hypothetical protein
MIKKGQAHAETAIAKLMNDYQQGQDFFLRLGQRMESRFEANGHVTLITPEKQVMTLHENAITQLATKYNIGTRFVKTLMASDADWKRQLIAHNLNEFSMNSGRERFLMRSVDSEIRGVLSDQYKILNSFEIASVFIERAMAHGAVFAGGHNSGLNMFVEVVHPELIQVDTVNNGVEELVFGARLKTSDYGCGSLSASIFYLKAICLNGAVGETMLQERHVGEKLPQGFLFEQDTHAAHTKAMALKMRDMTNEMFSEEKIANQIMSIKNASSIEIDAKKYIARLKEDGKILKSEAEETEIIMLNNKEEDGVRGASTLWKLTQAMSAMARDKDPVRQRELQEVAGSLVK